MDAGIARKDYDDGLGSPSGEPLPIAGGDERQIGE
jgi:hypothetical protein